MEAGCIRQSRYTATETRRAVQKTNAVCATKKKKRVRVPPPLDAPPLAVHLSPRLDAVALKQTRHIAGQWLAYCHFTHHHQACSMGFQLLGPGTKSQVGKNDASLPDISRLQSCSPPAQPTNSKRHVHATQPALGCPYCRDGTWQALYLIARSPQSSPCTPHDKPEFDNKVCLSSPPVLIDTPKLFGFSTTFLSRKVCEV